MLVCQTGTYHETFLMSFLNRVSRFIRYDCIPFYVGIAARKFGTESKGGEKCGGRHANAYASELNTLSIAHVDCDAFYASVENAIIPASAISLLSSAGGVAASCSPLLHARFYGHPIRHADVQGARPLS